MKKISILLMAVLLFTACKEKSLMTVTYPETKKVDSTDVYFGTEIKDPYRWLEDDRSDETAAWVKSQNEVTFGYLNKIPLKKEINKRLEKIWNFEKVGLPFKEGAYTYFYKNDGLQNQYVLYRQKGNETAEIFLDPNTFSKEGTTSLGEMDFTDDGSLIAYSISEGGSDWRKIIVLNTDTKEQIGDTIYDVKFTRIAWKGKEGFFYSSYDKPKGSELSAKTDQHKLYYHKLGTSQKEDQLIFGGTELQKRRYVTATVTNDDQYLIISAAMSTSGNELYLLDLSKPNSPLIPLISGFDYDSSILENDGSKLFIVTNLNAPNKRIVTVDAKQPASDNWVDFIPETNHVLNPSKGAGFIFAHYMVDAVSQVKQYDYSGTLVREIKLPGLGTSSGFTGKKKDETIYFSFTNYITPNTSYQLNPKTGVSAVYIKPAIDFNPDLFETKQVFYTSKDGTKIPMIISYKKGLKLNGKNPTIMYGYGGFNISLTPAFSIANAVWLEMGGIYAVPNIRGGGEYGKAWHNAGTQLKKQTVFDDFIAAAEYLMTENYTTSDYLALRGGSNGGLLVGAVMTQRPELAKVALPAVGVLDMLRYHTFTAGAGWAYDYGTADQSKEMFEYLKGYSPLHNVVAGIEYPATLITTADHDDRVVPAHSFKFAAELQSKQMGKNPVLIRIETNAGHGAGVPVSKQIEQAADIYAFTLYNMGVKKVSF